MIVFIVITILKFFKNRKSNFSSDSGPSRSKIGLKLSRFNHTPPSKTQFYFLLNFFREKWPG